MTWRHYEACYKIYNWKGEAGGRKHRHYHLQRRLAHRPWSKRKRPSSMRGRSQTWGGGLWWCQGDSSWSSARAVVCVELWSGRQLR